MHPKVVPLLLGGFSLCPPALEGKLCLWARVLRKPDDLQKSGRARAEPRKQHTECVTPDNTAAEEEELAACENRAVWEPTAGDSYTGEITSVGEKLKPWSTWRDFRGGFVRDVGLLLTCFSSTEQEEINVSLCLAFRKWFVADSKKAGEI